MTKTKIVDYSSVIQWDKFTLPKTGSYHGFIGTQTNSLYPSYPYSEVSLPYKDRDVLGFEWEYEIDCRSDYENVLSEIERFTYVTKLPVWHKSDCSLRLSYSREFNLAPQTVYQALVNFRKVDWNIINSHTKDAYGAGMHMHINRSWFKSRSAMMLFALLANSEELNAPLDDEVYGRPFDYYSTSLSSFLIKNAYKLIYSREEAKEYIPELEKITGTCVRDNVTYYDDSTYLHYFCSLVTYKDRYDTLEWRPFKSPRSMEDMYKCLAAFMVFIMFANKKANIFEEEIKSIFNLHPLKEDAIRDKLSTLEFDMEEMFDVYFASRFNRVKDTLKRIQ